MKIEIIPCLQDNYSYLIYEQETNTVSIVDPSEFSQCEKIIRNYNKLDNILITHHHVDHVGGNLKLKNKYNSKIFGYKKDKNRIPGVDILLDENQSFKIGNLNFKVIFIPWGVAEFLKVAMNKCFTLLINLKVLILKLKFIVVMNIQKKI